MKVTSNRTLAYWKECAVTLRQLAAKGDGSKAHLQELRSALRYAGEKIRRIESKVLVCLVLLILAGGCQMVRGGLEDISWGAKTLAENIETDK